jgi:hypothetical protein
LLFITKVECETLHDSPYKNFLYFSKTINLSLYPMLIVLQPHTYNNYGILLWHPYSYMISMILVLYTIEEKIWNDLTQAFSDFAWLKKNMQ